MRHPCSSLTTSSFNPYLVPIDHDTGFQQGFLPTSIVTLLVSKPLFDTLKIITIFSTRCCWLSQTTLFIGEILKSCFPTPIDGHAPFKQASFPIVWASLSSNICSLVPTDDHALLRGRTTSSPTVSEIALLTLQLSCLLPVYSYTSQSCYQALQKMICSY